MVKCYDTRKPFLVILVDNVRPMGYVETRNALKGVFDKRSRIGFLWLIRATVLAFLSPVFVAKELRGIRYRIPRFFNLFKKAGGFSGGFAHATGLDALCAHAQGLAASFDLDVDLLDVWQLPHTRLVVCVRDPVSRKRPLAADITLPGHVRSPSSHSWPISAPSRRRVARLPIGIKSFLPNDFATIRFFSASCCPRSSGPPAGRLWLRLRDPGPVRPRSRRAAGCAAPCEAGEPRCRVRPV